MKSPVRWQWNFVLFGTDFLIMRTDFYWRLIYNKQPGRFWADWLGFYVGWIR